LELLYPAKRLECAAVYNANGTPLTTQKYAIETPIVRPAERFISRPCASYIFRAPKQLTILGNANAISMTVQHTKKKQAPR